MRGHEPGESKRSLVDILTGSHTPNGGAQAANPEATNRPSIAPDEDIILISSTPSPKRQRPHHDPSSAQQRQTSSLAASTSNPTPSRAAALFDEYVYTPLGRVVVPGSPERRITADPQRQQPMTLSDSSDDSDDQNTLTGFFGGRGAEDSRKAVQAARASAGSAAGAFSAIRAVGRMPVAGRKNSNTMPQVMAGAAALLRANVATGGAVRNKKPVARLAGPDDDGAWLGQPATRKPMIPLLPSKFPTKDSTLLPRPLPRGERGRSEPITVELSDSDTEVVETKTEEWTAKPDSNQCVNLRAVQRTNGAAYWGDLAAGACYMTIHVGLVYVQLQGVSPLAFPACLVQELTILQKDIRAIYVKSHKYTGFGSSDDGRPTLIAFELKSSCVVPQLLAPHVDLAAGGPLSKRCLLLFVENGHARAKYNEIMLFSSSWRAKLVRLPNPSKHKDAEQQLCDNLPTYHRLNRDEPAPPAPAWFHRDTPFAGEFKYRGDGPDLGLTIGVDDMKRLRSGEFLNDTLVDVQQLELQSRLSPSVQARIHMFNSFLCSKLTGISDSHRTPLRKHEGPPVPECKAVHARIRRWTASVDLFSKHLVFVPVHDALHWSLLVLCNPGAPEPSDIAQLEPRHFNRDGPRFLLHLNSLSAAHALPELPRTVRTWLMGEWLARNGMMERPETWDGVRRMFSEEGCPYWKLDVPQQTNSSDCGLFMLHSIEQFIRDPSAVLLKRRWYLPQTASDKRTELKRILVCLSEEASTRVKYAAVEGAAPPPADGATEEADAAEAAGNDALEASESSTSIRAFSAEPLTEPLELLVE